MERMKKQWWAKLVSCCMLLSAPLHADQHWSHYAQTQSLSAPEFLAGYEFKGQEQLDNQSRSLTYRDYYNQQTARIVFQPKQSSLSTHTQFVKQQLQLKITNIEFAGEFKGTIRKAGQNYTFNYLAYRYGNDLLGHTVVLNSDTRTIVTSQVGPSILASVSGKKSKAATARYAASRLFSLIKALNWQDDRW